MGGCATFVMDTSRTCHRIFATAKFHALFIQALFMEQIELRKLSREA